MFKVCKMRKWAKIKAADVLEYTNGKAQKRLSDRLFAVLLL